GVQHVEQYELHVLEGGGIRHGDPQKSCELCKQGSQGYWPRPALFGAHPGGTRVVADQTCGFAKDFAASKIKLQSLRICSIYKFPMWHRTEAAGAGGGFGNVSGQ